MRLMFAAALAAVAAVAAAPSARAQESDAELKKRIMDKIAERLREEKKLILERMAKVIDEELAGGAKKDPAPGPAPAAPKTSDKRIRDLERKLQALDDQRDDLMRDIRKIRRENDDAKLMEEAKKSAPETGEEAQEDFRTFLDEHNEATKILATDREKAAKGFEKSIAGFKRMFYAFKDKPETNGHQIFGIPSAYNVACGYALLGKPTEAIDWIEIAIEAGYKDWNHIRQDTDFDGIRKERRFLRLLADR